MKNYKAAYMCRHMLAAFLAVCVMTGMLSSCSSDNSADIRDLLQGVPSDASSVMVVNTGRVLEKAGCKIDGDKATLSDEVKAVVSRADSRKAEDLTALLTGEAGNTLGPVAVFMEGFNVYVTGMTADSGAFKAWAEKTTGAKTETSNGVDVIGNVGIKGNRYWTVVAGQNYIQSENVLRFSGLSEKTSMAGQPCTERLIKSENDIEGWGDLNAMTGLVGSGSKGMVARLLFSSLFDDSQSVIFRFNFEKGVAKGSLNILNSKGENAKFLLPVSKIDEKVVRQLGESSDVVAAVSINSKFINKVEELAKSFGGGLPAIYINQLKAVDGTVCVAVSSDAQLQTAVVETTGEGVADLTAMLNTLGNVVKDGKLLKVTAKPASGRLLVSDAAASMKGAMFGVKSSNIGNDSFKTAALTLVPDGNSLKLEISLATADEKVNSIVSLLGAIK